jgi:hypothetical protein
MSFMVIEAGPSRAAQRSFETQDAALAAAREAWGSGKSAVVRLIGPDGALLWKRGASSDPQAEAADNAALAKAAGLSRLTIACPGIGGLIDLDRPVAPFAHSFEVEGGGVCGLLRGAQGSARMRDLLRHLDTRLDDAGREATLTGFAVEACSWPNPGHHRLAVELAG